MTQSIPVVKQLGIDPAKSQCQWWNNRTRSSIGASGSRILVTLIHELIKQNKELGLCSLCIGGTRNFPHHFQCSDKLTLTNNKGNIMNIGIDKIGFAAPIMF